MRNVGTIDRAVRVSAVILIAAAYGLGIIGGTLELVLGAVAIVLLFTALTSTCPAYMPLGISTRQTRR